MCIPGTRTMPALPYVSRCSSRTSPYSGAYRSSVGAGGGGGRELAVDRDDGGLRRSPAHTPVGQHVDVERHVGERTRAVHAARVVAAVDVGLDRVVDGLLPLALRDVRRDRRQHVQCRVEQHRAVHELGMRGRELDDQPPAERVTDPVARAEPAERLDEVGDMRVERPRRVPPGPAVPAQVGCENVQVRGPPLLRELLEPLAVRGDAVQAHDGRRRHVAPLVGMQVHVSSPLPEGR